uniref:TF_AP-2 domain-containing protein n=1 Tax=Rhabditophanes sp. KR3021 TaxID=114890 RepID=A0AC35TIV1_9BILA
MNVNQENADIASQASISVIHNLLKNLLNNQDVFGGNMMDFQVQKAPPRRSIGTDKRTSAVANSVVPIRQITPRTEVLLPTELRSRKRKNCGVDDLLAKKQMLLKKKDGKTSLSPTAFSILDQLQMEFIETEVVDPQTELDQLIMNASSALSPGDDSLNYTTGLSGLDYTGYSNANDSCTEVNVLDNFNFLFNNEGSPGRQSRPFTPNSGGVINGVGAREDKSLNVKQDDIFTVVPGRLCLLSKSGKLNVTIGELSRRIMGIESFNSSCLGAFLRRAKMPEKSLELVSELAKIGISIDKGRRRTPFVTAMSSLLEAEAEILVKDFKNVSNEHFPARILAVDAVQTKVTPTTACLEERKMKLEAAMSIMNEMLDYINKDSSPILHLTPARILPEDLQNPLSTYSLLTHGFGGPALKVGIETALAYSASQIPEINRVLQNIP